MAAASTPETYSLPREAMPYLPENRRNQTGDNMLKVEVPGKQLSKDPNKKDDSYSKYGAYGKKYAIGNYLSREKLNQIYQETKARLGKLGVFYSGKVTNAARKISYNPFRKFGLESRVGIKNPPKNVYEFRKPEYIRTVPQNYTGIDNLEERLAA